MNQQEPLTCRAVVGVDMSVPWQLWMLLAIILCCVVYLVLERMIWSPDDYQDDEELEPPEGHDYPSWKTEQEGRWIDDD